MHQKIGEDETCSSRDMLIDRHIGLDKRIHWQTGKQRDRQTNKQANKHARHTTPFPYEGQSKSLTNAYLTTAPKSLSILFSVDSAQTLMD